MSNIQKNLAEAAISGTTMFLQEYLLYMLKIVDAYTGIPSID